MNIIAIIPARGGSKGIPRKNIALLGGKPLLAHSIEQALRTPSISRVVVSTDDPEIAEVAREYGAEVVRRPGELSGDVATSESALRHALDELRGREGSDPDLVVFLQATSPLRQPGDIQAAIEALLDEGADSLFSACSTHGFIWARGGGRLDSVTYDHRSRARRQDGPEHLLENGSIYAFRPRILLETDNRLGGKIAVYRMHPLDSFQIDEPSDLEICEALLKLRAPARQSPDFSGIRLIALDFDGVMTDNLVHVAQDGRETVSCHRGDGLGIARAKEAGLDIVVLSTERNPVVAARCLKLGLPFVQGCERKVEALEALARSRSLGPEQVAFVGNDLNDLECLQWCGLPIAVADAEPGVVSAARAVTSRPGGRGAVREVMDWAIASATVGAAREAEETAEVEAIAWGHAPDSPSRGDFTFVADRHAAARPQSC